MLRCPLHKRCAMAARWMQPQRQADCPHRQGRPGERTHRARTAHQRFDGLTCCQHLDEPLRLPGIGGGRGPGSHRKCCASAPLYNHRRASVQGLADRSAAGGSPGYRPIRRAHPAQCFAATNVYEPVACGRSLFSLSTDYRNKFVERYSCTQSYESPDNLRWVGALHMHDGALGGHLAQSQLGDA